MSYFDLALLGLICKIFLCLRLELHFEELKSWHHLSEIVYSLTRSLQLLLAQLGVRHADNCLTNVLSFLVILFRDLLRLVCLCKCLHSRHRVVHLQLKSFQSGCFLQKLLELLFCLFLLFLSEACISGSALSFSELILPFHKPFRLLLILLLRFLKLLGFLQLLKFTPSSAVFLSLFPIEELVRL